MADENDAVGDDVLDGVMANIHRVIKYSNLNYFQVLELPCDMFQLMVKNSIVSDLMKSEDGRKEIEKYKRLNTTTADMGALSRQFNINTT